MSLLACEERRSSSLSHSHFWTCRFNLKIVPSAIRSGRRKPESQKPGIQVRRHGSKQVLCRGLVPRCTASNVPGIYRWERLIGQENSAVNDLDLRLSGVGSRGMQLWLNVFKSSTSVRPRPCSVVLMLTSMSDRAEGPL